MPVHVGASFNFRFLNLNQPEMLLFVPADVQRREVGLGAPAVVPVRSSHFVQCGCIRAPLFALEQQGGVPQVVLRLPCLHSDILDFFLTLNA